MSFATNWFRTSTSWGQLELVRAVLKPLVRKLCRDEPQLLFNLCVFAMQSNTVCVCVC